MAASSDMVRAMKARPDEFADLYRDIRGQFQKGKPLLVALKHLRVHGGDMDVEKWPEEYFEGLNPDEFTQTIVTTVTDDSRIFNGVQRYGIFFFRKNAQQHDARVLLTIQGGATVEELGGTMSESESPDHVGRTAQIMRHDEAYTRITVQGFQYVLTSMANQLTRSEAMVDKLLTTHVQTLDRVQDMLDRTAEREFKLERSKKMYALMDEGIEKLGAFVPLLIASKVEEKNPQLAAMIRQSAANPAQDILKMVLMEIEASPEKGQEILSKILELPNGGPIVQMLQQMKEMMKGSK